MNTLVLDASAVGAAFFDEEHADTARAILVSKAELLAPDLIVSEFANIVWKRHGRKEIDEAEAVQLLDDFLTLPLLTTRSAELVRPAMLLALKTNRTVYDCLYLALAVKSRATLISADKRLVNALSQGPLAKHVVWLGDYR